MWAAIISQIRAASCSHSSVVRIRAIRVIRGKKTIAVRGKRKQSFVSLVNAGGMEGCQEGGLTQAPKGRYNPARGSAPGDWSSTISAPAGHYNHRTLLLCPAGAAVSTATMYQGRCPWLGCLTPSGYRLNFSPDSNNKKIATTVMCRSCYSYAYKSNTNPCGREPSSFRSTCRGFSWQSRAGS